jgi:hypothetical protein
VPSLRTLSRPLLALAALLAVIACALLLVGASRAQAAVTLTVSPGIVHPDSVVTIGGSKDANSTVAVEIRPPGNGWSALPCAGTDVGSTSWSCTSGTTGRPFGAHQVRATETLDGVESSNGLTFQVVPLAVGGAAPPPPPPPPPPPTPTVTPTATVTPTPTVTPAPSGSPAATPSPRPTPDDGQLDTFALPDPTPTPTPAVESAPVTAPVAERPAASGSRPTATTTPDPAAPSFLDGGLTTLDDIIRNPLTVAVAGGIGGLILLLVAIPANILDSTIEANWERIRAPFSRLIPLRDRIRRFTAKLPKLPFPAPLVIVLATVAFGFTDPEFGIDLASVRLTAALALGLVLVVFVPIIVTRLTLGRRWHVPAEVVARPGAFVLALIGVLASRTIGFNPGILVGLVLGLELARNARADDRARATLIRLATTLGIALLAWIGYSALQGLYDGQGAPDMLGQLTLETLAAASSEGLAGVMVAVLPVTFLEGRDLFTMSKKQWFALAIPAAFAFALIVLPTVTTDQGPQQPIGLWIGVLIVFSLLVFAVWLTFRILEARHPWEGEPEDDAAGRSTEKHSAGAR